ncbi:MAG TPA: bacillithiol biosynthesis cysteine-adding enzyme BshC [Bacilli bacterium]
MLNVEEMNLPSGQTMTDDYINQSPRAASIFAHHFLQEAAWTDRVRWLSQSAAPHVDKQQLADALADYNEMIGNSPEAHAQAKSLANPGTLAVVGGQQAGLFTGPLYVIHKAITLIRLADDLRKRFNRPVVPVFWIAGEDHDFAEVNHIHYLNKELQVEKLTIGNPEDANGKRISVSKRRISRAEWEEAYKGLERSLADTEFKRELLAKVAGICREADTLAESFARIMAWLFGQYGLVLFDSDDIRIRKLESPFFVHLIKRYRELNDAYLRASRANAESGYAPQAHVSENGVNLFVQHKHERTLLFAEGGLLTDKKGALTMPEEELLRIAETAPERLSNNVLTRPLMQEYLFPVLATVLGPGEIAYWGQTGEAFRVLGMVQPIIVPRISLTLVEGTVRKQMQKYALSFADVLYRFSEKKREWLAAHDEFRLKEKFSFAKAEFSRMYRPLLAELSAINPGIGALGETNLQKILEQIDFLHHKAATALSSQHEAALRQLERIKLTIHPMEKPQERVYNCFAYLNRYGSGFIDELVRLPLQANGRHKIVYL